MNTSRELLAELRQLVDAKMLTETDSYTNRRLKALADRLEMVLEEEREQCKRIGGAA